MDPSREVLDALADLLSYPGDVDPEAQEAAVALVSERCPGAAAPLSDWARAIAGLDAGEREELFTRTFDNTAERSLEIGWQLFGENYARGALMVRLRALLREHGVPESAELPDHLSHVLRLLGRCPRPLAEALVRGQVRQALEKTVAGCRAVGSPYCGVLDAIDAALAPYTTPLTEAATP